MKSSAKRWRAAAKSTARTCSASSRNQSLTASRSSGMPCGVLRVGLNSSAHFSSSGETTREHANAGEKDPRLSAGDGCLEILSKPPAAVEPCKCAFDDPASRLGFESSDALRTCDDLDLPFAELGDRGKQLRAAVHTVGEDVTQPGKDQADVFQQRYRTVIVLDVGRVHLHSEQRAAGIGDNVTLAALHSLASIKPAWAPTFRRFHTLAVDDPSRRSALASRRSAGALHQHTIDPPPDVAVAPTIKIVLDRCERRKIFRQGAPLAAGGKNIENRIDDDAKVPLRRAPDVTPLRQQSAQQHPLFPRRIACIAQPVAA